MALLVSATLEIGWCDWRYEGTRGWDIDGTGGGDMSLGTKEVGTCPLIVPW